MDDRTKVGNYVLMIVRVGTPGQAGLGPHGNQEIPLPLPLPLQLPLPLPPAPPPELPKPYRRKRSRSRSPSSGSGSAARAGLHAHPKPSGTDACAQRSAGFSARKSPPRSARTNGIERTLFSARSAVSLASPVPPTHSNAAGATSVSATVERMLVWVPAAASRGGASACFTPVFHGRDAFQRSPRTISAAHATLGLIRRPGQAWERERGPPAGTKSGFPREVLVAWPAGSGYLRFAVATRCDWWGLLPRVSCDDVGGLADVAASMWRLAAAVSGVPSHPPTPDAKEGWHDKDELLMREAHRRTCRSPLCRVYEGEVALARAHAEAAADMLATEQAPLRVRRMLRGGEPRLSSCHPDAQDACRRWLASGGGVLVVRGLDALRAGGLSTGASAACPCLQVALRRCVEGHLARLLGDAGATLLTVAPHGGRPPRAAGCEHPSSHPSLAVAGDDDEEVVTCAVALSRLVPLAERGTTSGLALVAACEALRLAQLVSSSSGRKRSFHRVRGGGCGLRCHLEVAWEEREEARAEAAAWLSSAPWSCSG